MKLRVGMLSTFGPNVRGVSPYADELADALIKRQSIKLIRLDYIRPFPAFILPKGTDYEPQNEFASLDYLSPASWDLNKLQHLHIAHYQYWSPAFLPIILASVVRTRKSDAKIVVTWHNPSPHESIPVLTFFEKKLGAYADLIICHSETGVQVLRDAGVKCGIAVCHHGCAINPRSQPTQQDYQITGLKADREYLLFFGNIRPYKGLDGLLDAWIDIQQEHPNLRLIVAGRLWGQHKSFLGNLVHGIAGTSTYAKKIEQKLISLHGIEKDLQFVSEEKLEAYIRIAKLALFPYSSFESQSGAAARAAGAGLPIITTDLGGLTDLVINDNYRCESNSKNALRTAILNCLSILGPKTCEDQLIKAKSFSWESSAETHEHLYRDIL